MDRVEKDIMSVRISVVQGLGPVNFRFRYIAYWRFQIMEGHKVDAMATTAPSKVNISRKAGN